MKRPIVVAAILLAIFISAVEATVIATAMPTVVGDLGGLELYGWVSAVYMLAATITIPPYGKLADVFGRKPILLVGLGIFLVGSIGSGMAHSMGMLIAMRAVQGFGAGGIQPVALTIVGDLFPPAQRARMQGLIGFTSEPGEGAMFFFELPIASSDGDVEGLITRGDGWLA